jgi:hypothetical protein
MHRKKGKKININTHANYKTISGTVDNANPKSVYVSISSWANPKIKDELDYDKVLSTINNKVRRTVSNKLNNDFFYGGRYIIDFDMKSSGIRYGKKSFMNCEITLYQKLKLKLNENNLQKELKNIIDDVIKEVFTENQYFSFEKTKA